MSDRSVRRHHLAGGILKFVVSLAFFAMLYAIFNQFFPGFFDGSMLPLGTGGSSEVGELQGYIESAWIYLPAIVVFMLALRLVARAAFESRGGGAR
jgi:hypothetical protein